MNKYSPGNSIVAAQEDCELAATVAGIYITRRCNLRCGYCNVTRRTYDSELGIKEWIKVFEILEHIGIERVVILGGEPTLVPGIDKVVYYVANSTSLELSIVSNGVVSSAQLKRLADAGLEHFSTSLDTLCERTFDEFTLRKSQNTLEVMEQMQEWGVKHLRAYLVLSQHNLNDVSSIAQQLTERGIWLYLLPYHYGHGEPFWEIRDSVAKPGLAIDETKRNALETAVHEWVTMKESGVLIANSCEFLSDIPRHLIGLSWHCSSFPAELRVDADGSLMCCHDLRGGLSQCYTVFEIASRDVYVRFQHDRAQDAATCPGCFWPSPYHAELSLCATSRVSESSSDSSAGPALHRGQAN